MFYSKRNFIFFSGKMILVFDKVNFPEMGFDENVGHLYGFLLLHKTELIVLNVKWLVKVLNDQNEPDSNKLLCAIVLADSLANVFNCILNLYQMREYFR